MVFAKTDYFHATAPSSTGTVITISDFKCACWFSTLNTVLTCIVLKRTLEWSGLHVYILEGFSNFPTSHASPIEIDLDMAELLENEWTTLPGWGNDIYESKNVIFTVLLRVVILWWLKLCNIYFFIVSSFIYICNTQIYNF